MTHMLCPVKKFEKNSKTFQKILKKIYQQTYTSLIQTCKVSDEIIFLMPCAKKIKSVLKLYKLIKRRNNGINKK